MAKDKAALTRRSFFGWLTRGLVGLFVGVTSLPFIFGRRAKGSLARRETVWQINPFKCIECGQCATYCVLDVSAVRCVHDFKMCGYCKICMGFLRPGYDENDSGAENQMCPNGAIRRAFVEEPYYEYVVDEELCVGCGRCVTGCKNFGNGSLYLQVRHDLCLNCNECSIAANCPSDAFVRLPADRPYVIKSRGMEHA